MIRVLHGDCLAILPTLEAESVHVCVCDPPYHLTSIGRRFGNVRSNMESNADNQPPNRGAHYKRLSRGFMGQQWDGGDIASRHDTWAAVLRVLKPGGHLLAFGGTRTYHRMACAIEDAGFEIRDCLSWNYASGFPKGLNVVNQLIRLALWQSPENAPLAVQSSVSIRVRSEKEREPIAVALARILPVGGLALLTEIGGEVALHVPTDTWPSKWMAAIGLNTISLSNLPLEEVLTEVSKCITGTELETITDRRIYSWLIGLRTSETTIQCSATLQNGLKWPALVVASSSGAAEENRNSIQIVTALGSATWNPIARFDGFNVCLKPAWEPIILARKPLQGTVAANVLAHGCGGLNVDACRVRTNDCVQSPARVGGNPFGPDNYVKGTGQQFRGEDYGRWPANLAHDGSDEVEQAFAAFGQASPCRPRDSSFRQDDAAKGDIDFKRGSRATSPNDRGDGGSPSRFYFCGKATAEDRAGSKHPTVKPLALMDWLVKLVTPPNGTVLDPFAGSGTTLLAADRLGMNAIGIEQSAEYVADIHRRLAADAPLFVEVEGAKPEPVNQQLSLLGDAA